MNINIRPYKSGDAKGIFTLFQKYTPYERDEKFWVWINRILSHSIISIAEVNGEIVGHYAILPRTFVNSEGETFNSGLGIHAFVAPEWRNKVSIFSISSLAYDLAKTHGIDFIYGFPNKNYRLIQEKIEKWHCVKQFNALIKRRAISKSHSLKFNWVKIEDVSHNTLFEINHLLENEEMKYHHFKRDIDFWNKRYFLHPQKPYQLWNINNKDQEKGFVILKKYHNGNEIKLHIIDLVTSKPEMFRSIVFDIERLFYDQFDILSFWSFNKRIEENLIDLGFKDEGFDTFYALKLLNKDISIPNLLNFDKWHLTMGDSDAF